MTLLSILSHFVGISFIYYGTTCLLTQTMKDEFQRYGLSSFRPLIGVLQLLGGIGLIVGVHASPLLAFISSSGLFVLMVMGYAVRLKIKDGFIQSSPAFIYSLLSLYLAYGFLTDLC